MPLDRKTILGGAFAVLNEGGLESLTLRRLATRLGVQAPAIYWHFKNKQDLLDEMGTQVFRESLDEAPRCQDWPNWVVQYCLGLRSTLLRYRDGARMVSGTYMTDPALFAGMEASLRVLTEAGFTLRQSVVGLGALYCYVIGFVIEEQALEFAPGQPDARYDLSRRSQRVDRERFPLAHAAGTVMFMDHDSRFLEGVDLMIAGIGAMLNAEQEGV